MDIIISKTVTKQLKRLPKYIEIKFDAWCDILNDIGLRESRKYKGFHDEPLKGTRKGQRSVRLSKAYRAIYKQIDKNNYELIEIIEVNKHDY